MAATPDVGNLLAGQQAYNLWQFGTQLGAGRVNTTNPFGSQQWSMDPASGQWTLNQSFSPQQQALLSQSQGLGQQGLNYASGMLSNPNTFGGINYQGPNYTYSGGTRDAAEKALYGRATRYLDPQYKTAEDSLYSRLQSMGGNIADTGFQKSLDTFNQGRERAYADARDAAIAGGGQEATGELQRALASEGARTGFLRQERSDMANLYNMFRQGGTAQMPWSPAQAQYSTPGMPAINSVDPQIASWSAQQAAGANNQAGWWGLGNAYLNSPAGQNAMNGIANWASGWFA